MGEIGTKGIKIFSILFIVIAFVIATNYLSAKKLYQDRIYEPVILRGDILSPFYDVLINEIFMYIYHESTKTWTMMPFQIDENGAVVCSPATKNFGKENVAEMCPYSIPRRDEKSGEWFKCTFCNDRIANGLEPACVKACPTGTLTFGDREKILAMGKKRLQEIIKDHPNATLLDADDVRWIYLLHESEEYFQIGMRELDRFDRYAWRKLLKPSAPVWLAAGALILMFKKRDERLKKNEEKLIDEVSQ